MILTYEKDSGKKIKFWENNQNVKFGGSWQKLII